jgi:two-component system response regulator AtoC
MNQELRILVVEDSDSFRESLIQLLGVYSDVDGVADLTSAREALQKSTYQVVILDKNLPDGLGFDLIPEIKAESPGTVVIVMTVDAELGSVRKCIAAGADDYIVKSATAVTDLLVRIPLVVERAAERLSFSNLKEQVRNAFRYEIIGKSQSTFELRETVLSVKGTRSPVLITGESGTGKELIARRLHGIENDKRNFVALNCSAISESLMESELFGHKKGAFTGAVTDKPGHLELAHGGDLFLDEIGDLPLQAQAKLLRVLQDGTFFRVGGTKPIQVSCRIIAATNKNLEEMIRAKLFREDLFFRLNVVRIRTVPLRERSEDISDMSRFFCLQIAGPQVEMSEGARQRLVQHTWPGNIRELRNSIERAVIRARKRKSPTIEVEDLLIDTDERVESAIVKLESLIPQNREDISPRSYEDFMAVAEKIYLENAMKCVDGSSVETSFRLGLSRSTLNRKSIDLGIPRRTYNLAKGVTQ